MRRILLIIAGWLLILTAPLGAIVPVIPGWLMFSLGIVVLSAEYAWARALLARMRHRFPKFTARVDSFAERWLQMDHGVPADVVPVVAKAA